MTTAWNDRRGAHLASWRKRSGMRQVDLGDKVGVGKSTISAWERNERAPKPEQIEALHAVADELARVRPQEDAPSRWEVSEGVGASASAGDAVASDDDAHVIVQGDDGLLWVVNTGASPVRVESMTVNVVEAPAPTPDPYTTTIDWQRWAVEVDGVRGISLRAMVEAGLYSRMDHAVRALGESGLRFSSVVGETSEAGGRPTTDYLLTLADAQMFAASARTETGRQILRLIVEHHDEFQKLLAGDADAHERLADAQPNRAPEVPADPVMALLAAAAETRRAQLAHEARLAALEHQMARASAQVADVVEVVEDMREQQLADGEVYVGALADQHGWLTEAGNGYTRAVLRSLELAGARGHTRQIRRAAHHEGRAYHDVWVISAQGARLWRDQIRPEWEGLAEDGVVTLPGKVRCFVHLRGGNG